MSADAVVGTIVDPSKPQFNFEELSWGDIEDSILVATELNKAVADQDTDRVQAALDKIREFLTRVVVDVPPDWFVKNTPAGLELSDPKTYRYLRQAKFKELQKLMQGEMNPLSETAS